MKVEDKKIKEWINFLTFRISESHRCGCEEKNSQYFDEIRSFLELYLTIAEQEKSE